MGDALRKETKSSARFNDTFPDMLMRRDGRRWAEMGRREGGVDTRVDDNKSGAMAVDTVLVFIRLLPTNASPVAEA